MAAMYTLVSKTSRLAVPVQRLDMPMSLDDECPQGFRQGSLIGHQVQGPVYVSVSLLVPRIPLARFSLVTSTLPRGNEYVVWSPVDAILLDPLPASPGLHH